MYQPGFFGKKEFHLPLRRLPRGRNMELGSTVSGSGPRCRQACLGTAVWLQT